MAPAAYSPAVAVPLPPKEPGAMKVALDGTKIVDSAQSA
ncbi:hypothetical protein SAMN05216338_1003264 [Bradyrhizobium sp. Rc2d]|nr:hypothetical protein SAMN05216338_1003264 [Bradyrhizobium sp. Rc2d]